MKNKKLIVKVTIPRILVDNPMCCFSSRDGTFVQTVPINSQIVKWMKGKHEAYFELEMNSIKIVSMKPTTEAKYYGEDALKIVKNEEVESGPTPAKI